MRIRSDRTYHLPGTPDEVWRRIAAVGDYRSWWPWLRRFEARALAPGDVWECTLRPQVPYAIRCTITLAAVDEPRLVAAALSGDLSGVAHVELRDGGQDGTEVRLASDLAATGRTLRVAARLLPWAARWGHDRLLDAAAAQFAAARSGSSPQGSSSPEVNPGPGAGPPGPTT